MNLSACVFPRHLWLCLLPALALFFSGCSSTDQPDAIHNPNADVSHLHVGDTLTVTLDGLPTPVNPHEEAIKEDGTITLDDIGPIQAAGKTLGELQRDIYNAYVPRYYTHLNVTVTTSSDRVYYVQGEVNHPGEQLYREGMTVTRAIAAAGDFTDFANRKNVELIRAGTGQRVTLNCNKILSGDAPDPEVYTGDQVFVHRRLW
jgi:protein involved in polysaccharide export with SLBB domain